MYANSLSTDALPAVIISIGMACLSNILGAQDLLDISRVKYASALRLINDALKNPFKAIMDQTCMSVILLGFYEVLKCTLIHFCALTRHQTITCSTADSMRSWVDHIEGAAMLLALRGPEQLDNEIGREIFFQLRAQIGRLIPHLY